MKSLRHTICSVPAELKAHDHAFGAWPFDAAESEVCENLLPAKEGIRRATFGSSQGPAFDGGCTFSAGQVDRCADKGVGDTLASALDPHE